MQRICHGSGKIKTVLSGETRERSGDRSILTKEMKKKEKRKKEESWMNDFLLRGFDIFKEFSDVLHAYV